MNTMFPQTLETENLVLDKFCDEQVDVFELYDLFAKGRESMTFSSTYHRNRTGQ